MQVGGGHQQVITRAIRGNESSGRVLARFRRGNGRVSRRRGLLQRQARQFRLHLPAKGRRSELLSFRFPIENRAVEINRADSVLLVRIARSDPGHVRAVNSGFQIEEKAPRPPSGPASRPRRSTRQNRGALLIELGSLIDLRPLFPNRRKHKCHHIPTRRQGRVRRRR